MQKVLRYKRDSEELDGDFKLEEKRLLEIIAKRVAEKKKKF